MGGLVIASAIIIFNVYMFMHVSVGVCAHVWSPDNNHKLFVLRLLFTTFKKASPAGLQLTN